jgi:hypothetical protein
MKMVQKLSLLAMAITLVSCNEKVSPELQQGSATTPSSGGPTIVPDEYYFKLSNTASVLLNYKLHKTGAGNKSAACEVRGTTKLDNDGFRANPAANDISCYLDAEELSLQAGGLSFEIESSPNTCEFIQYSPFSYYNRIPGDSSGTYTKVSCMNDDTTAAHADSAATSAGVNIDYDADGPGPGVAGPAVCEQYLSKSTLLTSTRLPFEVNEGESEDGVLCRFNYQDGDKEKCDIGEVIVQDLQVTFDTTVAEKNGDNAGIAAGDAAGDTASVNDFSDGTDDDGAGPDDGLPAISANEATALAANAGAAYLPAYTPAYNAAYATAYAATPPKFKTVTRKIKCGGTAANCVSGPIKQHGELSGTRGSFIITAKFDEVTKYKQTYTDLIPDGPPNYYYANYRRDLANSNIAYDDSSHTPSSPYSAIYTGAWASAAFNKIFDPNVMERYARNRLVDNSAAFLSTSFDGLAPLTTWESNSTETNMFSAKPLAMEPFVGMGSAYYTNPYYTFYCLDTAYDIKARIRLVVRDWDRIFPSDSNIELLSDINLGSSARQDLQYFVEDPDSNDEINDFNDVWDWDDQIWMIRDDSGLPLIYRPAPTGNDADGFFNRDFFPEFSKQ